jgi:hypothetical protein
MRIYLYAGHLTVQYLKTTVFSHQCWGSGSGYACFRTSRIRIHQSDVRIRIGLRILPFSEIMLGSGSGFISQRYRFADPDPTQNVTDSRTLLGTIVITHSTVYDIYVHISLWVLF